MRSFFLFPLLSCLDQVSALALTKSTLPSVHAASFVRREAIPTFTLGPKEQYFPSQVSNPDPSGTSLQVYPTGIYEEFPEDGITIALGADLRKQITDTMAKTCNSGGYTQECQDALMPILHKTDLATHAKRFVIVGSIGIISLAVVAVAAIVYQMGRFTNYAKDAPVNIKLNHDDLAQIKSISGASTFAAVASEATAFVTVQPVATTTSPNFIIVETLPADRDNHKAGDIVYHIPQDAASRIKDFLAMTGMHETQNICKGKDVKRADGVQECLQHIQRHAMDLADAGPSDLLQLAQQSIPMRPASGQAIGFPVQNLAAEGIPLLIPVYRVIYENRVRQPTFDMGWDPLVLAKSATAIAIAAHIALSISESIVEIFISKDRLVTDLKEEKLACPRDVLCVADECSGQEEGKDVADVGVDLYCKKVSNFGCKCRPVAYGQVFEVEADYVDQQYEWLEELIKKSSLPPLEPKCDSGDQKLNDASKKVEEYIGNFCKDHADLKASFNDVKLLQPGFTFEFNFKKGGGNCAFDCITLFSAFVESDSCITGTGMQKNGVVKTECGSASYLGYNLV